MKTQTVIKMKKIFLAILTISLLTNCNNSQTKSVDKNNRLELVPEPDKALKEEYLKQKEIKQKTCAFVDPDTSVAGIKIHDVESTLKVLGKQTKLEGDSTHVFYAADKKQILALTVYAGSYYNAVSLFKIYRALNSNQKHRQINIKEFTTEKGIKLGSSKKEVINKLGNCYIEKGSTKETITLYYKIEAPNDSKTKLLQNKNMPIYYAWYYFKKDKLESCEFGFEYP